MIVVGAAAVLYGVWRFVDYRRKYRAAMRAQWEREQSDESAIREAHWIADKAYSAEIPDDELLARIRAGVEARRREVSPPAA